MSASQLVRRQAGAAVSGSQDNDSVIPETIHRFSITGTAVAGKFDQVPFYSLNGDVALSADHEIVAPVNQESDWSNAALWAWQSRYPAPLVNLHFLGWNNNVLAAGEVQTQKVAPDGKEKNLKHPLGRFKSAGDYQNDILTVPVENVKVDGYHIVRIVLPGSATPNKGTVHFTLGATYNPLSQVPNPPGRIITPLAG